MFQTYLNKYEPDLPYDRFIPKKISKLRFQNMHTEQRKHMKLQQENSRRKW